MEEKRSNKGRKKAVINWDIVDENLQAGCNGVSIAKLLGVHEDTLYKACERDKKMAFSAYSQQKRIEGNDLLLKRQFEVALNGNISMLIWLGKQRLNQTDKQEIKQDATAVAQIVFDKRDEKL